MKRLVSLCLVGALLAATGGCARQHPGSQVLEVYLLLQLRSYKYIFRTMSASLTGDLQNGTGNGITGADSICAAEHTANFGRLGFGTYKALVSTSARVACTTANCSGGASEHSDWVLAASTEYRRAEDGAVIATTTAAGIFGFPLTAALATTGSWWTGLQDDWQSGGAITCSNWTSTAGTGYWGQPATDSTAINDGGLGTVCTGTESLLCVEQ